MQEYQNLWNKTLEQLALSYSEDAFNDIFGSTKQVVKFANSIIYVLTPNIYIKTKINNLYYKRIQEILQSLTHAHVKYKFVVAEELVEEPTVIIQKPTIQTYDSNLNVNYNFESFVVGESNMMGYRMAMKVAEQPGEVANPLYIFGGVGLGKTHLMQAIGNYMLDSDIERRILYVQANTFIEDYSKATQRNDMASFDAKYDNLDALLIDDIQMLEIGKKSQQEFFKLFNYMEQKKKQIVITSDCPADQLKGIMDRLTSRFSRGLTVDIKSPDLKHRVNILKRKILEKSEKTVSDEVLEYIASNYTNNIRELEGGFNRVLFYCVAFDVEITIDKAKEALAPLLKNKKQNGDSDNYEKVQSVVASFYNISIAELISTQRSSKYVLPRHICMYILKIKYNLPYKKIGLIMGGKDHTTVISGCAKIEQERKSNTELQMALDAILKKVE